MNATFKQVLNDKIIRWGMRLSLFLLILEILSVAIVYYSLPPFLPLFNQMPWGESRLGTNVEIFLPPIISGSFLLLNFFLLTRFYEGMPLVSRMLSITSLLIAILSCIFIMQTLYLVI